MTSIFVAKLDFGVSSEQLKQLFEQHGQVLKASVAMDRETGKSRGFGFVEMDDSDQANAAIRALDGYLVNGRPIAVKEAEQRTTTKAPGTGRPYTPPGSPASNSRQDDFEDKTDLKTGFIPNVEGLKIEPRKKVNKDKKTSDKDTDNRSKKPKMDAYKKSGKKSSFFDDDDDIDDDLLNYKRRDDDDDDDDE